MDLDRFLTFAVADEAMLPLLRPGDLVLVERGAPWGHQDVVLARVGPRLLVRRVVRGEPDREEVLLAPLQRTLEADLVRGPPRPDPEGVIVPGGHRRRPR